MRRGGRSAGLIDVEPVEVGAHLDELRFWVWDAGDPDTGWVLRLAVESRDEGIAWALAATDST